MKHCTLWFIEILPYSFGPINLSFLLAPFLTYANIIRDPACRNLSNIFQTVWAARSFSLGTLTLQVQHVRSAGTIMSLGILFAHDLLIMHTLISMCALVKTLWIHDEWLQSMDYNGCLRNRINKQQFLNQPIVWSDLLCSIFQKQSHRHPLISGNLLALHLTVL